MSRITTFLILAAAALLETGGDALIRLALGLRAAPARLAFFACGAAALFAYGYVVNVQRWDFGRLLGIYVVVFFITAQLVSWLVFHQPPTRAVWLGGAFILTGGVILSWSL